MSIRKSWPMAGRCSESNLFLYMFSLHDHTVDPDILARMLGSTVIPS